MRTDLKLACLLVAAAGGLFLFAYLTSKKRPSRRSSHLRTTHPRENAPPPNLDSLHNRVEKLLEKYEAECLAHYLYIEGNRKGLSLDGLSQLEERYGTSLALPELMLSTACLSDDDYKILDTVLCQLSTERGLGTFGTSDTMETSRLTTAMQERAKKEAIDILEQQAKKQFLSPSN
jgi:hypothetical protein